MSRNSSRQPRSAGFSRPGNARPSIASRQFVEARQSETVLTGLDEPLVDALERALAGGRSLDRGSRSADRIDVMTVHQAKGLEFDTVLAPFLSDRHWCVDHDHPARSRHELLSATLDPTVDSPLCTDLATESVREEWRVFHVAITRAANHLLLFGAEYAYDPPEALGVTAVEDCLPDAIEWGAAGARMDLWSTLGTGLERVADSHPQAVADVTDDLAAPGADREPTIAGPTGTAMTVDEAIGAVHRLGWLLRNDLLLPAADAASAGHEVGAVPGQRHLEALTDDTVRFPVDSIVAAEQSQATVRHSHSALATHERCPRRHYLDHVVFATADPTEGGAADGRVVGSLFHDIAEECFYRGFTAPGEWQAVAQRHLTARDLEAHTDAVLACVDRYFQAEWPALDEPVHAWEALAAELRFTLEAVESVEGPVVGYVDSIRRLPDGRCAVLDYKATADRIDPSEAGQLTLYAEACRRRYDLSVDLVGYVYVGAAGPGVDLFDPSSVPDWRHLRESLATLESPRFDAYQSGPHCATCPHTSLGCAPDSIVEDR
ncbi:MAG: PD-(D/E)XK nuclease family protein [Natrialbaceae archaeon]|nr:PD-(D/E)XK nuclease family protein [Natrialbaceae archaeon]